MSSLSAKHTKRSIFKIKYFCLCMSVCTSNGVSFCRDVHVCPEIFDGSWIFISVLLQAALTAAPIAAPMEALMAALTAPPTALNLS